MGGPSGQEPLRDVDGDGPGDAGHGAYPRYDRRVAHPPDQIVVRRGRLVGVVRYAEERVLVDLGLYGEPRLHQRVEHHLAEAVVAHDVQYALPVAEGESHSSSWIALTEQALMQDPQAMHVPVFSLTSMVSAS